MREIQCKDIIETIKTLCIEATSILPQDVYESLQTRY